MSFSQNGYSEEVFKVAQLSRTVLNGKFNDESAQGIQPPPGFKSVRVSEARYSEEVVKDTSQLGLLNGDGGIKENPFNEAAFQNGQKIEATHDKVFNMEALKSGEVQSKEVENSLDHPPGFEPHLSPTCVNSEETSFPPGFEEVSRLKVETVRGRTNRKRQIVSIGKRVTRSQSKSYKDLETRSKKMLKENGHGLGGKEGNSCANDSVETPESIRKIAEEALEIGELLGLKVVANRGNAVKRITESLKNARVSKCNRKEQGGV